jgi:hypothetical protein
MRKIEDALRHPDTRKEDIITIFLALQKQSLILGNNVSNLVSKWPFNPPTITPEDLLKFGISSETNDSTTI